MLRGREELRRRNEDLEERLGEVEAALDHALTTELLLRRELDSYRVREIQDLRARVEE